MHRHLSGLAIAGLTAAHARVAGTGSAQDKEGYQGVPRTFLWANGPIEFTDTAQYKKDPPYVIGFSNASVSNIWRVGMQHAIEAAAARHADQIDKLIITDANDDPAKQAADIQDLVEREVDLLIVSPATAEALDPAVTRAMSRGIPVILVDRRVTSDNFVSFVTATDWALARLHGAVAGRDAELRGQHRDAARPRRREPGREPDQGRARGVRQVSRHQDPRAAVHRLEPRQGQAGHVGADPEVRRSDRRRVVGLTACKARARSRRSSPRATARARSRRTPAPT